MLTTTPERARSGTAGHRAGVLLAALCFSTTGTAQALGPATASPVAVGAARLVVGALGLLAVTAWTTRTAAGPGLPRGRAVLIGAAGVAAYQVGFFLAVRLSGVAVGTVVALGSAPVVTGALAWALGRGRPGARWAATTACAVVGLVLLVAPWGERGARPTGVALAVLAAAGYAAYTVATKDVIDAGATSEQAVTAVFLAGAVLTAPALVLLPTDWLWTVPGLATVLWLGLVTTTLAYVLFARGLSGLPPAEVATLTLAEPVAATVLGVVVLDERLDASTALGAGLVVVGLALLVTGRRS